MIGQLAFCELGLSRHDNTVSATIMLLSVFVCFGGAEDGNVATFKIGQRNHSRRAPGDWSSLVIQIVFGSNSSGSSGDFVSLCQTSQVGKNLLSQGRSEGFGGAGPSISKGQTSSRQVAGIFLPGASIEKLEKLYWNK